jgi:pimeloyl-ACP methyl ester carboxylesterase
MTSGLFVHDIGDGPVVVLLHAFPCDGRMWEPQAVGLAEAGWRVLVPDLPGFGRSAALEGPPSLDAVAHRIVEHLDLAGIDRCVVGGISLGGYVTMALMRIRPDLLAAAILCDTKASADSEQARESRERLARMCLETPDECGRILEQAVLPGLLGDSSRAGRPEAVRAVTGWLYQADATAVAWFQRAMAGRPDSIPTLTSWTKPTLVVWGAEDGLSPRTEQDLMMQALSDADLAVVPGAGHLSNVEDPRAVTEAMRAFLAVVRGPQSS